MIATASTADIRAELQALNDRELIDRTKALVDKERDIQMRVIDHLREIERRRLHLARGYPSLFEYATGELGYSEGAAHRRIKAMRLCREVPEADARLRDGKLTLTTASQLQNLFENRSGGPLRRRSGTNRCGTTPASWSW